MKEKSNIWPALLVMAVFAVTRCPGVLPQNFSAAYAIAFCAGVYFPARLAWWLPLVTMAFTDLGINAYYYFARDINAFQPYQLINYAAYAVLIWLGRRCQPQSSWLKLLGGGILGAILFYLLTNTAAWFFNPFGNPEYTRTLAGWIAALTCGTANHPPTWEFFRNTLLSGGLFTGLFVGAMKFAGKMESTEDKEPRQVEPPESEEEPAPEEAKA